MIKKEQILDILNTNTEWLSDNDVVLKSDFNKVADAIVKLCNLHVVSKRSELLISFSEYLHKRDLLRVVNDNIPIRVKLFLKRN